MIAAIIAVLRVVGGDGGDRSATAAGSTGQGDDFVGRVNRPTAVGKPLTVNTPEGFVYRLEAAGGGSSPDLEPEGVPAAAGQTFAYVDYVLTNTGREPALLDFPPDVFLRRSVVPVTGQDRCIPRVGAAKDVCALPSHSKVVGRLGDSPVPETDESGDTYIPAGASYLVRAAVDLPMPAKVGQDDLSLYVWGVRFTGDRLARPVVFP